MSSGHSKRLLTVSELIAQLQQMPGDLYVYLEGTEADAEVTGVQLDRHYRRGFPRAAVDRARRSRRPQGLLGLGCQPGASQNERMTK